MTVTTEVQRVIGEVVSNLVSLSEITISSAEVSWDEGLYKAKRLTGRESMFDISIFHSEAHASKYALVLCISPKIDSVGFTGNQFFLIGPIAMPRVVTFITAVLVAAEFTAVIEAVTDFKQY